MLGFKPERVLVLAPHADDGELGCGGAIARFVESGARVHYQAFSMCEDSVPPSFARDELEREMRLAVGVLGIPHENVIVHRYQVRRFHEQRQAILEDLLASRRAIEPDVVLMPCTRDIHQDHQVVAAEAVRAFKNRTMLSYEMPWNNLELATSAFIPLEARHVDKKVGAFACYRTQAHRPYSGREFAFSLAKVRGIQIGCEYAEAFECVRLVL